MFLFLFLFLLLLLFVRVVAPDVGLFQCSSFIFCLGNVHVYDTVVIHVLDVLLFPCQFSRCCLRFEIARLFWRRNFFIFIFVLVFTFTYLWWWVRIIREFRETCICIRKVYIIGGSFFLNITALHYFFPNSVSFLVRTRRGSLLTILAVLIRHVHPLAHIVRPPPVPVLVVVAFSMRNVVWGAMRQPVAPPLLAPFAFGRVNLVGGQLLRRPARASSRGRNIWPSAGPRWGG